MNNVLYESLHKYYSSDKNLKTANIKQFIFPGKFTLTPKKIIEFKGPQYLQFTYIILQLC